MTFKMLLIMALLFLTAGCAVNSSNTNNTAKKPLTNEELKSYISIRNSQQVIETGYSMKKSFSSNYRFLTQKYIDLLIPELRKSKVKMDISGDSLVSIELYKISIPRKKVDHYQSVAKLFLRIKLPEEKQIQIVLENKLTGDIANVNAVIHKMISDAVFKTMHNQKFLRFIKNYV